MNNNFYQGETISIGFKAVEDDTDNLVDISMYKVSVILYNSKRGRVITMSTDEGGYIEVERPDNSNLQAVIPARYSAKIYPGQLTMEIQLIHRDTDNVVIAKTEIISLSGCKIAGIER